MEATTTRTAHALAAAMAAAAKPRPGQAPRLLDVVHGSLLASPDGSPGIVDGIDNADAGADGEVALVKDYPGALSVELPAWRGGLEATLEQAIVGRSSHYEFASRSLSLSDLGGLLHLGAGTKRLAEAPLGTVPVRMAPSAGSLQPVNLYVAARRVEGVEAALYHYHPVRHALELARPGDPGPAFASCFMQEFVAASPVVLVLTCSLDRVVWHYGPRAYRSAHLDAGVLAQNLMLAATGLGLASCAVFGFYDELLDAVLGADGHDEFTALALALGHPVRP